MAVIGLYGVVYSMLGLSVCSVYRFLSREGEGELPVILGYLASCDKRWTLSRAHEMTVATVIAGQVMHIRTTVEQPDTHNIQP